MAPLCCVEGGTPVRDRETERIGRPSRPWRKWSNCIFTATLRCGTVLTYEARTFRPDAGDLVPCRHHGYCVVRLTSGGGSGGAASRRARPRAQEEPLDWLGGRSEPTVHALRRHGFTLRMVAAEREGLVELDLPAGRVTVRPAIEAARRATNNEHRWLY
jgi:ribosomal protein L34